MEKVYCICGCGKETYVINHTNNKVGRIRGRYSKYISGHNLKSKESQEKRIIRFKEVVKGKKEGIFKNCINCNKKYYVYPSEERNRGRKRKYCSNKCVAESNLGNIPWNKGIPHTLKHKLKLRETRKKQITPTKDTSIEVKIQDYLKKLNVDFFTHQYMKDIKHGYQCDIFIPVMDLIIECDGDYWHKYPIGRDIDNIRTKELIDKGFKVLRLWEREIKEMSINEFKEKLETMRFL